MPCCCVRSCKNRSETSKKGVDGITFHLFPKNGVRRKNWINAIRRENWNPSRATVVCSKHFEEGCFYRTKNGLIRLLDDALPSLHIPLGCEDPVFEDSSKYNQEITTNVKRELCDLPVLRVPVIDEDESPKAKLIASNIRRLLIMCKKQRKAIRKLKQMIYKQDVKIKKSIGPAVKVDCLDDEVNEADDMKE